MKQLKTTDYFEHTPKVLLFALPILRETNIV